MIVPPNEGRFTEALTDALIHQTLAGVILLLLGGAAAAIRNLFQRIRRIEQQLVRHDLHLRRLRADQGHETTANPEAALDESA